MIGMFAISKAGHDKGQVYIITEEGEEYVSVADGKYKTMESPKRKNKKHIQIIKDEADPDIINRLQNKQLIYNEEIKRAIKIRKTTQKV